MGLQQNRDMFLKAQTKDKLLTEGIFDVTNDRGVLGN